MTVEDDLGLSSETAANETVADTHSLSFTDPLSDPLNFADDLATIPNAWKLLEGKYNLKDFLAGMEEGKDTKRPPRGIIALSMATFWNIIQWSNDRALYKTEEVISRNMSQTYVLYRNWHDLKKQMKPYDSAIRAHVREIERAMQMLVDQASEQSDSTIGMVATVWNELEKLTNTLEDSLALPEVQRLGTWPQPFSKD